MNVVGNKDAPDQHLYTAFAIPAKMFQRRWLLLNKPVGTLIKDLVVDLETADGERARYGIKLK